MPLFNFDKYLQLCFYISFHKNHSLHSRTSPCSLSALVLNFPYGTCIRSLVWVLSFDLVHSDTLSIILNSTNYRLHFSIKFYHSFRVSSSKRDENHHFSPPPLYITRLTSPKSDIFRQKKRLRCR